MISILIRKTLLTILLVVQCGGAFLHAVDKNALQTAQITAAVARVPAIMLDKLAGNYTQDSQKKFLARLLVHTVRIGNAVLASKQQGISKYTAGWLTYDLGKTLFDTATWLGLIKLDKESDEQIEVKQQLMVPALLSAIAESFPAIYAACQTIEQASDIKKILYADVIGCLARLGNEFAEAHKGSQQALIAGFMVMTVILGYCDISKPIEKIIVPVASFPPILEEPRVLVDLSQGQPQLYEYPSDLTAAPRLLIAGGENGLECAICLDDLNDAAYIYRCNHVYCQTCVERTLDAAASYTWRAPGCPSCRQDASVDDLANVPVVNAAGLQALRDACEDINRVHQVKMGPLLKKIDQQKQEWATKLNLCTLWGLLGK